MKRRPHGPEKELADRARLLRAWKAWHQEQLDKSLAGAHGAVTAQLMTLLDRLELNSNSAATLLASVQRIDWSTVSCDVCLTLLHQVNQAIARLRERKGLAPLDEPVFGEPDDVFRRIKHMLFAAPPGAHPGSNSMKQRNDEQVKYEQ